MAKKKSESQLSIIMPVLNEDLNIKIMVAILNAALQSKFEILIVHDTPQDRSVPVVKQLMKRYKNLRLVLNPLGKGVIHAIKSGVAAARGEYILLFAVDEIGPIMAIETMKSLLDDGCDFVSCTRYAHGGRRLGGSILGGYLSRMANFFFKYFSGSALTDATTGIKMFRKKIFESVTLESKPIGWACVFELAIKVQIAGYELGEVPIDSVDRLYGGQSSFKPGPWIGEYLRWFFWGMKSLPIFMGRKKPNVRKVSL